MNIFHANYTFMVENKMGHNTLIVFVFATEIHQILSKIDYELYSTECNVAKSHCITEQSIQKKKKANDLNPL